MAGIRKERTQLGDNIRGLRKMWGETQLDLAIAIGLDNGTTISNYENGRTPERDILIRIAKHYRITENELLYSDFKNAKPLRAVPLGISKEVAELVDTMIPQFSSPSALENEDFKIAYEMHQRMLECLFRGNGGYKDVDCLIADFRKCIECYKKASDQKIIEATANYTGLLALVGLALGMLNKELWESFDIASESSNPPNNIEFLRNNGFLPFFMEDVVPEKDDEIEQLKKQFMDLYEVDFFIGIVILKRSKNYNDLGDYYFALRYAFNILSNTSLSPEMYRAIGFELLYTYDVMHNKYAQSLTFKKETKK